MVVVVVFRLIASNLVCDGATLQMGIGNIPNAVLDALTHHKVAPPPSRASFVRACLSVRLPAWAGVGHGWWWWSGPGHPHGDVQ